MPINLAGTWSGLLGQSGSGTALKMTWSASQDGSSVSGPATLIKPAANIPGTGILSGTLTVVNFFDICSANWKRTRLCRVLDHWQWFCDRHEQRYLRKPRRHLPVVFGIWFGAHRKHATDADEAVGQAQSKP